MKGRLKPCFRRPCFFKDEAMPEISVYGLTEEEIKQLTQLAKQHYGKASVS